MDSTCTCHSSVSDNWTLTGQITLYKHLKHFMCSSLNHNSSLHQDSCESTEKLFCNPVTSSDKQMKTGQSDGKQPSQQRLYLCSSLTTSGLLKMRINLYENSGVLEWSLLFQK